LAKITRKGRGKRAEKEEESMARSEKKLAKSWPKGGRKKLVKGTRKGERRREEEEERKRQEEVKKRMKGWS
jgi:hypothetical protein